MIAWVPFTEPVVLSFYHELWFLLPLCAGVGIVYKTIRAENLRALPVQILALFGYMVVGLVALGAGLWLLQEYWPR